MLVASVLINKLQKALNAKGDIPLALSERNERGGVYLLNVACSLAHANSEEGRYVVDMVGSGREKVISFYEPWDQLTPRLYISSAITQLRSLVAEHGDLPIVVDDDDGYLSKVRVHISRVRENTIGVALRGYNYKVVAFEGTL